MSHGRDEASRASTVDSRGQRAFASAWVFQPATMILITYATLYCVRLLWLHATLRLEGDPPYYLLPTWELVAATCSHVVIAVVLIAGALRARSAPVGVRRGYVAGVVLGLTTIVVLQYLIVRTYGPHELVGS